LRQLPIRVVSILLSIAFAASPAAGRLQLAGPYPLVVRSDDVAGLRPGLKALILGRCPNRTATKPVLRALQGKGGSARASTVYARAISNPDDKLLPPKCPVPVKP
jgi:hypothetical protein